MLDSCHADTAMIKIHATISQILQERSNASRNILLGANMCKSAIHKHQKRWVSMWNEIHQNSPGRSSANSCWYKFLLPKVMALILHHLAARRVFGPKHLHAQFSRLVAINFAIAIFFVKGFSPFKKKSPAISGVSDLRYDGIEEVFIGNPQSGEGPTGVRQILTSVCWWSSRAGWSYPRATKNGSVFGAPSPFISFTAIRHSVTSLRIPKPSD